MYIKKTKTSKGRIFLQVVEGFRNGKGKATNRVVKKIGYQDELDSLYNCDAFSHFKAELHSLNASDRLFENITFKSNRQMNKDKSSLKNVGYLALKLIFKALKPDTLSSAFASKYNTTSDISSIFDFLIYSKVIDASSKISSFIHKDKYFENFSFSEDQMYNCLSYLGNSWESIKDYVFHTTDKAFGLDLSKSFYDGTNFYFKINYESEFQKKGPSKENRHCPIISQALLLDEDQIPLGMSMFPGNESEMPQIRKTIQDLKERFDIKSKIVQVADKGLNCARNIYAATVEANDGYIFSKFTSLRWSAGSLDNKHTVSTCYELSQLL